MRAFLLLVLLLAAPDATVPAKQRGFCYAHSLKREKGYGTEASAASLAKIKALGADWISVTPFAFQSSPADAELRWVRREGTWIDETDERMRAVVAQAHAAGLRVMMKPHVWLRPPGWPGAIAHDDEDRWRRWFASYEEFILHYAKLSSASGVDAFCIGNELQKTTHRGEWRRIIREVRKQYRGPLTYGANFTEVESVPFWKELDFIGVSAYFPLAEGARPSTRALIEAWKPYVARLRALSRRTNRRIVFTELGYRGAAGATARPWETGTLPPDDDVQRRAYEAFFTAVWNEPWLGGVYFWKWESYPGHARESDGGFWIENKPAERIVRKYFAAAP